VRWWATCSAAVRVRSVTALAGRQMSGKVEQRQREAYHRDGAEAPRGRLKRVVAGREKNRRAAV